MNFHNDKEERKPVPPVLGRQAPGFRKSSVFGKTPAFSRAAGGIMERLKGLSRRDLGLVALGISALVMAPVAEFMMSRPPMDNSLTAGFGTRDASAAASLYEPGIHGLSQGSPDGSGEVIVPLSARDPLSLILGASKPAPPSMPSSLPPSGGFRDAVRDSGREAFAAAVKSAGAPTVIPKMQTALRGMSSFFGGGESSRTSGALSGGQISASAKKASGKAASRSMVGPIAAAGYKGVALTPNSSSKGAFEKLRSAADKAAGNFTDNSAARGLDKAAADSVNIGSGDGGIGSGMEGDKTKGHSNSSIRDQKSNSGESLQAQLNRKRAERQLEWDLYKQFGIKQDLTKAMVSAFGEVLGDFVKSTTKGLLGMNSSGPSPKACYKCNEYTDAGVCTRWTMIRPATTDEKAIDAWIAKGICDDIRTPSSGSSGTAAAPPATGNASDLSGPVPPADISSNSSGIYAGSGQGNNKGLDGMLTALAKSVKEGKREESSRKFVEWTRGIAERSVFAAAEYSKAGATLLGMKPTLDGKISEYGKAIDAASQKMIKAEADLKVFSGKVNALDIGKRKDLGGGALADADETTAAISEVKAEIETADRKVKNIKLRVLKHKQIKDFYAAEAAKVEASANIITNGVRDIQSEVSPLFSRLDQLKNKGEIDRDEQAEVVDAFKTQTKVDPMYRPVETAVRSASLDGGVTTAAAGFRLYAAASIPSDLRDAPDAGGSQYPAAEDSPVGMLMSYRGADLAKLWSEKVDDSAAKTTERGAWDAVSPYLKYGTIIESQSDGLSAGPELPADVISVELRARNILWDINNVSGQVTIEAANAEPKIADWTKKLQGFGLLQETPASGPSDINSPARPNPVDGDKPDGPAGPGQRPVSGGSGVSNAAVTKADGILSGYEQATIGARSKFNVLNSAASQRNCTSTSCKENLSKAKTSVGKMESLVQEVRDLRQGAGRDGLKAEDISRIEGQLVEKEKQLLDARSTFDTSAGIVERLEGIPSSGSSGAQPPIVINNNVNADASANANAAAKAEADAAVGSDNPSDSGKKPLPAPMQTLYFNMPDNRSMQLDRASHGNQGGTEKAVYEGWHREEGRNFGVLAKDAKTYRVTCTRGADGSFTVSNTESRVVAFPAGEDRGILATVGLKRLLRMENISIGSFKTTGEFNGQPCH